ncbi:hypothetical protein E2C01_060910 [Portunus trituberculatus]|uniref:Uncharacterized protein n=1 Tax=Portunus trituberculatus TaxID=210409 RepID=A0A5B7HBU0_PORTR|nr:hypothetical protein [Portunus trituberculatus]
MCTEKREGKGREGEGGDGPREQAIDVPVTTKIVRFSLPFPITTITEAPGRSRVLQLVTITPDLTL